MYPSRQKGLSIGNAIHDLTLRTEVSSVGTKCSSLRRLAIDDCMSLSSSRTDSTRSLQSLDTVETVEKALRDTSTTTLDEPVHRQVRRSSVGFTTVEVKQYNLVLGDNPNCSYPLSLDWEHSESYQTSVNEYEISSNEARRLDVSTRIDWLMKMGFSKKELRIMERDRKMSLLQEWKDSVELMGEDIIPPPRSVIRID